MAAQNRKRAEHGASENDEGQSSVGNRQQTTQAGGQNNGGRNLHEQEDAYSDDLRQSGERHSSNRKEDR